MQDEESEMKMKNQYLSKNNAVQGRASFIDI